MAIEPTKTKAIIGVVIGLAALTGAFFCVRYLMKNSGAKKSGAGESSGGGIPSVPIKPKPKPKPSSSPVAAPTSEELSPINIGKRIYAKDDYISVYLSNGQMDNTSLKGSFLGIKHPTKNVVVDSFWHLKNGNKVWRSEVDVR